MSENNQEILLKSAIDALIEDLFAEEEAVEKSLDIAKDSVTTFEEAQTKAPSLKDDKQNPGRPKEIRATGNEKTEGSYDSEIAEKAREEDLEEIDQVSDITQVEEKRKLKKEKAEAPKVAPFKKSLTEEEFEEYQALKKAKEEASLEQLRKAELEKTEALIKSVIEKTSEKYKAEIEGLKKSLTEQENLLKAIASKPVKSQAITNLQALEKSQAVSSKNDSFSKKELLDAAEELCKSKKLKDTSLIELENTGYIYDAEQRSILETYLKNK
ncbi:MAG: hypothetical protein MOGMAGMI_00342 [Candidatus Omnitrophica bacterium]|nr:hypothetical protein [Candidatus Omnitrophota bacterium]